ncbi:MAG TPA: hypothetical protein VN200_02980 [Rhodoglobus sp.]|nr:hypothetical protein [Rhodoglobus sp.]
MPARKRRRVWPWVVLGVALLVLVPTAAIVLPILLHRDAGLSNQQQPAEAFPGSVTARGDDGRTRELSVPDDVDTAALAPGDRIVVTGSGYDASRGIYVAICVIPDDPAVKPGPCIGGAPSQEATEVPEGTVQYAPSNWINDDWAWRLFGARAYDDVGTGSFTAYLEVGEPAGDGFDCREDRCGIVTRNDHTAAGDRVQDLAIPVAFAP